VKPQLMILTVLISVYAISPTASAQVILHRFVLVAGANSGGADRPAGGASATGVPRRRAGSTRPPGQGSGRPAAGGTATDQ